MPDLSPFPLHVRDYLSGLWKNNPTLFWDAYNRFAKAPSIQAKLNPPQPSPDPSPASSSGEGSTLSPGARFRRLHDLAHGPTQPERDEVAELVAAKQANALELLRNFKLSLRAYAEIQSARIVAKRRLAEVPEYTPLLEAMLEQQNVEANGVARDVALALLDLALHVGNRRGYHPLTAEVAFHVPQTLLAAYLWPQKTRHAQRKAMQRGLAELERQGMVSSLSRAGTARKYGRDEQGRVQVVGWMYDGTVFNVRIRPSTRPVRRVSYDDVAQKDVRDLDADIKAHNTVEALLRVRQTLRSEAMSQSNSTVERLVFRKELKEWALPPSLRSSETLTDWDIGSEAAHRAVRNAIQDVRYAPTEARMSFVGAAASTLAKALSDQGGRELWVQVLGGARVLFEGGDGQIFQKIQHLVGETMYEHGAGQARKPGAVLVLKLRKEELYERLLEAWKARTFARRSTAPPPEGDP